MARQTQAAPAPDRKPGRPPADGTDQRIRLLDAALLSFSQRGIAGTSLRSLAADAGVTPAMLNYYFGSKERLVDAVVNERLLPVLDSLRQRLAAHADADCSELVAQFVTGMHAMIEPNPWLPGLWVREVLTEGGHLRDLLTERFAAQIPRPLATRFARGQADGELNAALDPRLLFVSLIGLTMLPYAAAPVWRKALKARDIDGPMMLRHTLALLQQGIAP